MTIRVNMWSSPRNLSTAMMYSWRQREDTTVVDEPLYAHYLAHTGRVHPDTEAIINSQNSDGESVVSEVLLGEYSTPVVFFKQMVKHLVGLDRSFLESGPNILLTREPHDMLSSLQVQLPDLTIDDTGFVELVSILNQLVAAGQKPIVVETRALLANPAGMLSAVCEQTGVDFDEAMLSWPKGPKPEDGIWAPHWYDRAWKSTGWEPYEPKSVELTPAAESVLPAAQAEYEQLLAYCLTP